MWCSVGRASSGERFLVVGLVARHHDRIAEPFGCGTASGGGHTPTEPIVGQQPHRGLRHAVEVGRRMEKAAHAGVDELGKPAHPRRDDRDFARHRLERRQPEAFLGRREQQHL